MLPSNCRSLYRLIPSIAAPTAFTRNTWILSRVHAPPVTPPGKPQRDPSELRELQRYEVVDFETKRKAGPIQVILLEDVEGVGHQFDVVSVARSLARQDLLPCRKAVYASPFDLQYYARMKEKMASELAARVRIPFEFVSVGRKLQQSTVPLRVNMENPWTINRKIVVSSLRQEGILAKEESVFLPPETLISGPMFDMEAKLLRFYIVVSKQYIVPMLGRLMHISADESKQVLVAEKSKSPSKTELAKFGLREEEPFYHKEGPIPPSFDVIVFMKNRQKSN